MTSPYAALAALVVLIATGLGSGWLGYRAGADHYKAQMEAQAAAVSSATAAELQRQQDVAAQAQRDAIAREDAAEAQAAQTQKLVDAYVRTLATGGYDALSDDDVKRLKAISGGK